MQLVVPLQILDYEASKNDTEYEEYETYEDGFEFAEREKADTWDGEVNLTVLSHIKWSRRPLISNNPRVSICFSHSGWPQSRERPEGGASCYRTGELLAASNE